MNKTVRISALIIIVLSVIGYGAYNYLRSSTKKHSPLDVAELREGSLEVDVTYCRPYKKDRLIFGDASEEALQPNGEYWRLGANEATIIALNRDIMFGGKPLKKGNYSMYAIPGEDVWIVAVNSATGQWGYSEPNYDEDVLRVEVPVNYTDEPVEQLTISFEPGSSGMNMVIRWDTSIAKVSID